MKKFKEFYKEEQLNESIAADLAILTKDVSKIAYNVGVIGAKALGRGSVRAVKALAQRYSKQAIADRKAAKELKKLDKAEALRKAKATYVDAKMTLEKEKEQIMQLSKTEKDLKKSDVDKAKKQIDDGLKKLNVFAKKNKLT
jgi:DNA-binding helix-hairpin-helix protein with protein kinase domain